MDCNLIPYKNGEWVELNTNVSYKVVGDIVCLSLKLPKNHASWTTLGILPAEIRPHDYVMYTVDYRSGYQKLITVNDSTGYVEYLNSDTSYDGETMVTYMR